MPVLTEWSYSVWLPESCTESSLNESFTWNESLMDSSSLTESSLSTSTEWSESSEWPSTELSLPESLMRTLSSTSVFPTSLSAITVLSSRFALLSVLPTFARPRFHWVPRTLTLSSKAMIDSPVRESAVWRLIRVWNQASDTASGSIPRLRGWLRGIQGGSVGDRRGNDEGPGCSASGPFHATRWTLSLSKRVSGRRPPARREPRARGTRRRRTSPRSRRTCCRARGRPRRRRAE